MKLNKVAAAMATLFFAGSFGCCSLASAQTDQDAVAAENSDAESDVEVIQVTSRALNLYRNGASSTAKLSVDPLDATQMITSINASLIRDQGARDAKDLYRNIAGVSLFSYAGVTARGFRQEEIFFDGLRGDPYVGFNVPQLFNVEQVDFLKGPTGMLYGPGDPGGLFNYITKKPSSEFSANVRGIVGNFSRQGISGEITGGLSQDGAHAGRLGVFYEDQDTLRDNAGSETTIVDLGYSFDFNEHLLTLQYTRYEQDLAANRLRGVPVDDDGNFLTNIEWNHNEPTDFLNLESDVFQASLQGNISDAWQYQTTLRLIDNHQEQKYHEPRLLLDTDNDGVVDLALREFRDQIREEKSTSFALNLTYEGELFDAEHRVATGVEYFDGEFTGLYGRYRPYRTLDDALEIVGRFFAGQSLPTDIVPLRLVNPNYGDTDASQYTPRFSDRESNQERTGTYLLNELSWSKFTLVAGLRYDAFEDSSATSSFDENEITYRLGVIYKPADNVSFYGQWADSYVPQSIGNQAPEVGGAFDPVTGEIIEFGVNAELFDDSTLLRVATYRIERQNLLQSTGEDPEGDGRDNLAAIGEVTSDGLEVEIITDITPDWVLSVAYAYNDARITADNGGGGIRNSVGDKFANAPQNTFGFWTRYQIPDYNIAFAFGGDYVGERLSLSGQTVQSYFIADASIIYEVDDYSILLRVDNLFDKEYAESGFLKRTGHFPGESRTFFAEFTYKW